MSSVKLEDAIKPINTLLWLQAVRTIHILISGSRIHVGSPGALAFFHSFFFWHSLLIVVAVNAVVRRRGKKCLFINNEALYWTAELSGNIVLDFMGPTAHGHTIVRQLISLFRPQKTKGKAWKILLYGNERSDRNTWVWVWRIREDKHFSSSFPFCMLSLSTLMRHIATATFCRWNCCPYHDTSLSMRLCMSVVCTGVRTPSRKQFY